MATRSVRKKKTSPVFLQLAELETDVWWKELLTQMGTGYFPHKMNFSNATLMAKQKNNKYVNFIINRDISLSELLDDLKNFLRKEVGISSDLEHDENQYSSDNTLCWNHIHRSTIMREIFIYLYIRRLNITDKQKLLELKQLIWFGFAENRWHDATFTFKNGQIIDFNPNAPKKRKTKT